MKALGIPQSWGQWFSKHYCDADGNPAGGESVAIGIEVDWQDGPLDRPHLHNRPNGACVEDGLLLMKDRLKFYQTANGGKFACVENQQAIEFIDKALESLESRTARRELAGTEGTHEGS